MNIRSVTTIILHKRKETEGPAPVLQLLGEYPGQTAIAAFTGLMVGMMGCVVALFVQSAVDHTRDLNGLGLFSIGVAAVLLLRSDGPFQRLWKRQGMAVATEGGVDLPLPR